VIGERRRDIPSGLCAQTAQPLSWLAGPKRRADDLDPVASKDLVKSDGEFLVPIANEETDVFGRSLANGNVHGEMGTVLDDEEYENFAAAAARVSKRGR
jgi:hypothetical protein